MVAKGPSNTGLMLKVRYKNENKDPFWITERLYSIGTAADNNLAISDASLAPHHAKLVREHDTITLKDLGSDSGTYVNGQRINTKAICCGDVIRIGKTELQIADPLADTAEFKGDYWSLIGSSSWLAGQEFPLVFDQSTRLILGRGTHCDIVFPGTHLSREHAAITRHGNIIEIEDLKSANATYVNDKRIEKSYLRPGDQIRLDVYSFRVFGPGIELHKAATKRVPAVTQSASVIKFADEKKAVKDAPEKKAASSNSQKPPAKKQAPISKEQNRKQASVRAAHAARALQPQFTKTTKLTNWLLVLLLLTIILSVTLRVLIS